MSSSNPGESGQHQLDLGRTTPKEVYRDFMNKGLSGRDSVPEGLEEFLDPDTVSENGVDAEVSSVRVLAMGILAEVIELSELDYEDVGDTVRCDAPVFDGARDAVGRESTIPVFDLDSERFDED